MLTFVSDSISKIKVMQVIARLNIGGATMHVVNLSTKLDPECFDSMLVSGTENPGEGSLLDYALSCGVRPIVIPEIVGEATFKARDGKALAKLYHLIRQKRPHIVHTHTAKAGFLGRLAAHLAGVPVVIHTFHGHVLHSYYPRFKTRVLRQMEQTLARISHQIIAVSEQVKSELVFHGVSSREKITVIPLGFDLTPFLSCEAQKGEFKRELGLGNGARLVGIVGRIFPIKNHRLFLETAALVSANDPSARFVIVGDGLLRNELERHTLQLGIRDRVFFTGWRRDLPRIYADLDVLVVSSDNEGTPVSAIEAMASGCPVVSTQVGGLPDMITDGESGYLVPPRDPKAMAIFILRLLNDAQTAYKMSRNARAIAQERFNIKRLVTDIEKLYQALLKQKNILA